MSVDPAEGLKLLLDKSGISPGSENALKFRAFLALLLKWNARINLTASTGWNYLRPLFEEGIWAARFYPDWPERHLDIGSGAGFPGIPLAILAPHAKLEMVESRAKKAFFLENVVIELALGGARVHQARLQEFLKGNPGIWDCFSWKGLKLSAFDLEQLSARANSQSLFWIFHGKDLAVQDPEDIKGLFEMVSNERFPGRKEWRLSILKKVSSSELKTQQT
jgi:16S rRNA (guanine(527)-N(7))-methyltransferase RsmG